MYLVDIYSNGVKKINVVNVFDISKVIHNIMKNNKMI